MNLPLPYIAVELLILVAIFLSFYLYGKTKYPGTLLILISGAIHILQLIIITIILFSMEWPSYLNTLINEILPLITTILFVFGFSKLAMFLVNRHE